MNRLTISCRAGIFKGTKKTKKGGALLFANRQETNQPTELLASMEENMRERQSMALVVFLIFILTLTPALAADKEYPMTYGPIITDTATTFKQGGGQLSFGTSYSMLYGQFNRSWSLIDAPDIANWRTVFQVTYGLTDRLQICLAIPVDYNSVDLGRGFSASDWGIGDMRFGAKYSLLPETENMPAIAWMLNVGFPTGNGSHLDIGKLATDIHGIDAFSVTTGANFQKMVGGAILYANLWYQASTESEVSIFSDNLKLASFNNNFPDAVILNLAVEYPINKCWVPFLELNSRWETGGRIFGGTAGYDDAAKVSFVPGLQYIHNKHWQAALGYSIDAFGKNANAAQGPLLAIHYNF